MTNDAYAGGNSWNKGEKAFDLKHLANKWWWATGKVRGTFGRIFRIGNWMHELVKYTNGMFAVIVHVKHLNICIGLICPQRWNAHRVPNGRCFTEWQKHMYSYTFAFIHHFHFVLAIVKRIWASEYLVNEIYCTCWAREFQLPWLTVGKCSVFLFLSRKRSDDQDKVLQWQHKLSSILLCLCHLMSLTLAWNFVDPHYKWRRKESSEKCAFGNWVQRTLLAFMSFACASHFNGFSTNKASDYNQQ